STPTSGAWLFVMSPTLFLPMSRALTCASCPDALNNGVFTEWQQAAHESVSHCAFGHVLTFCVTPGPTPRGYRTHLYILRDSPSPAKARHGPGPNRCHVFAVCFAGCCCLPSLP